MNPIDYQEAFESSEYTRVTREMVRAAKREAKAQAKMKKEFAQGPKLTRSEKLHQFHLRRQAMLPKPIKVNYE